jgi:U3 small nucleolar RNA-associated protein 21
VEGTVGHIPFLFLVICDAWVADERLFAHLKSLTPPAIDLELRTSLLLPSAQLLFVHALTQRLRSHRDFEAVQALLAVFLRLYGEVVVGEGDDGSGRRALEDLLEVQRTEAGRVMKMVTASLGTLSFVRETL